MTHLSKYVILKTKERKGGWQMAVTTYICGICGYVYDGEDFLKEADDYRCPLCDHGKDAFNERSFDHEVNLASDEYHRVKKEETK